MMINDLQQIDGNFSEIIAKMSSNSIRADCNMKHFLIDKDEQLQFETRSREYCYDDRLRSCRHFCFVNVPEQLLCPSAAVSEKFVDLFLRSASGT